jgi:hypothetical protein
MQGPGAREMVAVATLACLSFCPSVYAQPWLTEDKAEMASQILPPEKPSLKWGGMEPQDLHSEDRS